MKTNRVSLALGLASIVAVLAVPGQATPRHADFLARFAGTWAGGGMVFSNEDIGPISVRCKVTGRPAGTKMSLTGSCKAALIFSRTIGAEIALAGDGRFVGTYTGSRIGPARLSGRANGNSVTLTTTWPKDVFGDKKAKMVLTNTGDGKFSMVMTDRVDGKTMRTTNVTFKRT